MKKWWMIRVFKGVVFVLVVMLVLGFIVMSLWNALIPELFKGPGLTFWQAMGLLILSHILLRGWSPWRHSNGWRRDRWKRRFEEKLAGMTPEEREKFKSDWRSRCGWDPEAPGDKNIQTSQ